MLLKSNKVLRSNDMTKTTIRIATAAASLIALTLPAAAGSQGWAIQSKAGSESGEEQALDVLESVRAADGDG